MSEAYEVLISTTQDKTGKTRRTGFLVSSESFESLKARNALSSDDTIIASFHVRGGQSEAQAQLLANILCQQLNELAKTNTALLKANYMRPVHVGP